MLAYEQHVSHTHTPSFADPRGSFAHWKGSFKALEGIRTSYPKICHFDIELFWAEVIWVLEFLICLKAEIPTEVSCHKSPSQEQLLSYQTRLSHTQTDIVTKNHISHVFSLKDDLFFQKVICIFISALLPPPLPLVSLIHRLQVLTSPLRCSSLGSPVYMQICTG